MAICGASGFVAHPPMNIANATKAWTGHFIHATYSAARRQHLPCSTRSSYGLTRLLGGLVYAASAPSPIFTADEAPHQVAPGKWHSTAKAAPTGSSDHRDTYLR